MRGRGAEEGRKWRGGGGLGHGGGNGGERGWGCGGDGEGGGSKGRDVDDEKIGKEEKGGC